MRPPLTQQSLSLADLVVLRPRLSSDEALLGVGSTDVWSYAGYIRAPRLILADARPSVWFENLVLVGLFHIVGTPADFAARLYSRLSKDFDEKLLRDTVHLVTRAAGEHLGRTIMPREKAGIFEVLMRHATSAASPDVQSAANDAMTHFLADAPAFNWLSGLVRNGHVLALRDPPFDEPCVGSIKAWLDQTTARLALCFFVESDAFSSAIDVATLPNADTTRVITCEHAGHMSFTSLSEWHPPPAVSTATYRTGEHKLFVDEDWDAWCERILAADPAHRPAEVGALANALGVT